MKIIAKDKSFIIIENFNLIKSTFLYNCLKYDKCNELEITMIENKEILDIIYEFINTNNENYNEKLIEKIQKEILKIVQIADYLQIESLLILATKLIEKDIKNLKIKEITKKYLVKK